MDRKNGYIAVFDSGLGGISVLRELRRLMPGERFLYFGDSANAPYGSRPTEDVRALTLRALDALVKAYPVKAMVIACNTATAAAVEQVRETYPDTIVVGIEPALKVAADHFPRGRIGVMATQVTLREEKFDTLVHRFNANCTVVKIPAPGLVELIEAGRDPRDLLEAILAPYKGKLDALVLGCTHYPFAAETIRDLLGDKTALLDGGPGTARETRRRLEGAGLLSEETGEIIMKNSSSDSKIIERAWKLLDGGETHGQ